MLKSKALPQLGDVGEPHPKNTLTRGRQLITVAWQCAWNHPGAYIIQIYSSDNSYIANLSYRERRSSESAAYKLTVHVQFS